ncbi:MAG: hypothetical protein ABI743_11515 [bacterium]
MPIVHAPMPVSPPTFGERVAGTIRRFWLGGAFSVAGLVLAWWTLNARAAFWFPVWACAWMGLICAFIDFYATTADCLTYPLESEQHFGRLIGNFFLPLVLQIVYLWLNPIVQANLTAGAMLDSLGIRLF